MKGDKIDQLNKLIATFKVPHVINRRFPRISDKMKLKSSEIKLFVFHLSVPMLLGFLPVDYWYLLCLYVFSIRTLYEPCNQDSLRLADIMIRHYHDSLGNPSYFGKDAYSYTIHAHLHLPDQVSKHGPLHSHSQFVFEVNLICMHLILEYE